MRATVDSEPNPAAEVSVAHLLVLRGTVGAGKSFVAKCIKQTRPAAEVVEIDHVKLRKYGTTTCSRPENDFPEAGRVAKGHLDQGRDTILVEAFVTKDHLDLALREAGKPLGSEGLIMVWLECSLDTSVCRKTGELSREVVVDQYSRYSERHKVPGEHVIVTDGRTISEVADDVLARLSPRFGNGSPIG